MTPPTDLSSPPTDQGAQQRAERAADEATTQAGQVASTAKDSAAHVAEAAGHELHAIKAEATDAAKSLVGDARQQLRTQAADQASKLSSTLGDLSSQLRSMAEGGSPGLAQDVIRDISQRADAVRNRLDERGIEGALDDAKRFARNRPGLFLAGAAAAGLLVGRVIKTTDTHALVEAAKPTSGTDQGALSTSSFGELPSSTVGSTTGAFPPATPATAMPPGTGATQVVPPIPSTPPPSERSDRPLRATGEPTL
jgi:hypothetical protein